MKMKSDELERIIFEATEQVLAEQGLGSRLKSAWSAFKGDKGEEGGGTVGKNLQAAEKAAKGKEAAASDITTTAAGQQLYDVVYSAVQDDFLKIKDYVDKQDMIFAKKVVAHINALTGKVPGMGSEEPPEEKEKERRPIGFEEGERRRAGFVQESLIKAIHDALAKL